MLKTHIDKAKVLVTARFKNEGSVLRETVQAEALGFETRCELTSNEPANKVAKVVRQCGAWLLCDADNPQTDSGRASIYSQRGGVRPGGTYCQEIDTFLRKGGKRW